MQVYMENTGTREGGNELCSLYGITVYKYWNCVFATHVGCILEGVNVPEEQFRVARAFPNRLYY